MKMYKVCLDKCKGVKHEKKMLHRIIKNGLDRTEYIDLKRKTRKPFYVQGVKEKE